MYTRNGGTMDFDDDDREDDRMVQFDPYAAARDMSAFQRLKAEWAPRNRRRCVWIAVALVMFAALGALVAGFVYEKTHNSGHADAAQTADSSTTSTTTWRSTATSTASTSTATVTSTTTTTLDSNGTTTSTSTSTSTTSTSTTSTSTTTISTATTSTTTNPLTTPCAGQSITDALDLVQCHGCTASVLLPPMGYDACSAGYSVNYWNPEPFQTTTYRLIITLPTAQSPQGFALMEAGDYTHDVSSLAVAGQTFSPSPNVSGLRFFALDPVTPTTTFTFQITSLSAYQVILAQLYLTGCTSAPPPPPPPIAPPACPSQGVLDPTDYPVNGNCAVSLLLPPLQPNTCYTGNTGYPPTLSQWYPVLPANTTTYYLNYTFATPQAPTGFSMMQVLYGLVPMGVTVAGTLTMVNQSSVAIENYAFPEALPAATSFLVEVTSYGSYIPNPIQLYLTC